MPDSNQSCRQQSLLASRIYRDQPNNIRFSYTVIRWWLCYLWMFFSLLPPDLISAVVTPIRQDCDNLSTCYAYDNVSIDNVLPPDLPRQRRRQRDLDSVAATPYWPPRIVPDLPTVKRFFDQTGAQIQCRAQGSPQPRIRWFAMRMLFSTAGANADVNSQLGSTAVGDNSSLIDSKLSTTITSPSSISSKQSSSSYRFGLTFELRNDDDSTESARNASTSPSIGREGIVVSPNGWLNFTPTQSSSTMRLVVFCQADNRLGGRARSRLMVLHQVPMPDKDLRVIYATYPIKPSDKAVVSCQPEQGIFNRFVKVKYWEVYLNGALIDTVNESFGRYSFITITKHPELHIRSITDSELDSIEVRCVLQSIVDGSVTVEPSERARLQRQTMTLPFADLRSVDTEVNVLRGSTIELPLAIEGGFSVRVQWSFTPAYQSDNIELPTKRLLPDPGNHGNAQLVDGPNDNLKLINLSRLDSGSYKAKYDLTRKFEVTYLVRVRAPLGAKITPSRQTIDLGHRVELTCEVTGYPRDTVYWLHNAQPLDPSRHRVRRRPASDDTLNFDLYTERLVIDSFSLDDVGSYQCVVESGLATTDSSLRRNRRQILTDNAGPFNWLSGGIDETWVDNSQASALLTMGRMPPLAMGQSPLLEAHFDNAEQQHDNTSSSTDSDSKASPLIGQARLSLHASPQIDLLCRFAANPSPDIRWLRDDQLLPLDPSGVLMASTSRHRPDDRREGNDKGGPYGTVAVLKMDLRKEANLSRIWTYAGEYRAVASNQYGQADCRTLVFLDTPLRIRPPSRIEPAIAGREYTLKCYAIANSIPTFQWHRIKSGGLTHRIPVDHRHQLRERGRVLRITEVSQDEDEADYRCTATLNGLQVNITLPLKVSHAPLLSDGDRTKKVMHSHDMLSESCGPQNRADQPWYAWWEFRQDSSSAGSSPTASRSQALPPFEQVGSGDFIVSYVEDVASRPLTFSQSPDRVRTSVPDFVHDKPNSAVHVTVKELRKNQHHGKLTCIVMNAVGQARQSIYINFIPELEFDIRPPNNKHVVLGQAISINCTAKASEMDPQVDWRYLQKATNSYVSVSQLTNATNRRIVQLANGTLHISSVDESDPGEFWCFLQSSSSTGSQTESASASSGQKSSAVNLEVHVPARIDPPLDDIVEKVRGSQFNLTCSVYGDADDDLQVAWYYRRSTPTDSEWKLLDQPCLVPLTTTLDGSADSSSKATSLADCSGFEQEGVDSGLAFRQVSYFKPNKQGIDRQLQFSSVKEVHQGEYLCRTSNVFNTDPRSDRRISVEDKVQLIVISVPDPVQFVDKGTSATATSVSLAWQPPSRDGNKPIRKYRITYTSSEEKLSSTLLIGSDSPIQDDRSSTEEVESLQQPNITKVEVDAGQHMIELTSLHPFTKYHLTVSAVNDVGASMENALTLTTQEAKPSGPVRELIANGTSSDTILVEWLDPFPNQLNGRVDRYHVCRQRVNETSLTKQELNNLAWPDDDVIEQLVSKSIGAKQSRKRGDDVICSRLVRQRQLEIKHLPKFTGYAFRVVALNSKGASPPAFVQTRTLEDLPQAPPSDVVCSVEQHSVTLSWNPPQPESINGILTAYHVTYFADNIYGDETTSDTQLVEGQTRLTLAGLHAFTNYTLQVSAANSKGRGPASPRLVCRTKEAPPGPPGHVKAKPINESCVMVSWTHPVNPQGATRQYCLRALVIDASTRIDTTTSQNDPSSLRGSSSKRCVSPDLSQRLAYYAYCGLSLLNSYQISVYAVNEFDGKPTWSSKVQPAINPPIGIASIGANLVTQNKLPVMLDCLLVGSPALPLPIWTYPPGNFDNIRVFDNGSLLIESAGLAHSGIYECSFPDEVIEYNLKVQEIIETPPRSPRLSKFTPSLHGIQAEWLSPGSARLDAPIQAFYLNWTNAYTGLSDEVCLNADVRTYFLANLTCATKVDFQLKAENKFGNSSLTDVSFWKTIGTKPLTADSSHLIPAHLSNQTSVTFNMSAFQPGNGCRPLNYHLIVVPAEAGRNSPRRLVTRSADDQGAVVDAILVNRTLTSDDLLLLDGPDGSRSSEAEPCCFNVSGLTPGAHYLYHVEASNPAGQTKAEGRFFTLTSSGKRPVLWHSTHLGRSSFLRQAYIMVPVCVVLGLILFACLTFLLYWRHRCLADRLVESHGTGADEARKQRRRRFKNDLKASSFNENVYEDDPSPPPTGSRLSSRLVWLCPNLRSTTGYSRGCRTTSKDKEKEFDQLSTHSVDSQGNLSPYAIYAPVDLDLIKSTAVANGGRGGGQPINNIGATLPASTASLLLPASRVSAGYQSSDSMARQGHHHYHYPDLTDTSSSNQHHRLMVAGPPHPQLVNNGGRLLPLSTAALVDPMTLGRQRMMMMGGGPMVDLVYNGSSSCGEDDFSAGRSSIIRRANSFDSLVHQMSPPIQHIDGQGGQTYHRGFALQPPVNSASSSNRPNIGGGTGGPFYDPGRLKSSQVEAEAAAIAYRGSLLSSSTTASSNQDELLQAYEYGLKQARQATLLMNHQPPPVLGDSSGDDSSGGIRHFTQPVPITVDPSAATRLRTAASSQQPQPSYNHPSNHRLASRPTTYHRHPSRTQQQLDCRSEATETYASVDYQGTPYGGAGPPHLIPNGGGRVRQPLPALPAGSSSQHYGHPGAPPTNRHRPQVVRPPAVVYDSGLRQRRVVVPQSSSSRAGEESVALLASTNAASTLEHSKLSRTPRPKHALCDSVTPQPSSIRPTAMMTATTVEDDEEESVYTSEFVLV